MTRAPRVRRRTALLPLALLFLSLPALAAGPDRDDTGEGDRVERRREWFFETRRDGAADERDMARRRAEAVRFTRRALQAQAARRAAFPLRAAAPSWVSRGPSPSEFGGWTFGTVAGRVSALTSDAAGTVYLGSASGGLWKSTDQGTSWTQIFDQAGTLTVGAVEVDPNDPQVLWAGTGENNQGCESYFGIGLLRSTDGGLTWQERNGSGSATLESLSSFADVVVDPRDSAHVVTGGRIRGCGTGTVSDGGIWTSADAGATWSRRLADTRVYEIQQDPAILDVFWAATARGIYKSTDNAVSWTLQTSSGLPNGATGRTELALAPSNTQVVYALFESQGFWQSTDGGASWTQRATGSNACDGQCSYNMVLRVHPSDPQTVYRGTVHVFKSTDGGATWTDLSGPWGSSQEVHQDTHALMVDPAAPEVLWVGGDGGVWRSGDGGATFVNRNGNLNLTQFYAVGIHPTDPGILCGGAQDNSSLARQGSDVWKLQVATGDGFVCHFNRQASHYVYATSYPNVFPSVYRSTTGLFGSYNVVTSLGSGIDPFDRINWVTPYLLDPLNGSTLYLGTHKVYKSMNNGSSWTKVSGDVTGGTGSLLALEIHRAVPAVLHSGSTSGKVWRTVNGGAAWTDITAGLPARAITDLGSDPSDTERVLATVGGFGTAHLWEWRAGAGWTARGGGLPDVPAGTVHLRSASEVYVGTDVGLFRSLDGGATFDPFMDGLPLGLVVTDLKEVENPPMLTAGTYGRGAWQIDLGAPPAPGPGRVADGLLLARSAGGDLEATWPASCNAGELPGQVDSVQAGDLDALRGGTYTHAPLAGDCARTSPSVFTPGAGSEYYLVVPNEGGREGDPGTDSAGAPRPQVSTVCGPQDAGACP